MTKARKSKSMYSIFEFNWSNTDEDERFFFEWPWRNDRRHSHAHHFHKHTHTFGKFSNKICTANVVYKYTLDRCRCLVLRCQHLRRRCFVSQRVVGCAHKRRSTSIWPGKICSTYKNFLRVKNTFFHVPYNNTPSSERWSTGIANRTHIFISRTQHRQRTRAPNGIYRCATDAKTTTPNPTATNPRAHIALVQFSSSQTVQRPHVDINFCRCKTTRANSTQHKRKLKWKENIFENDGVDFSQFSSLETIDRLTFGTSNAIFVWKFK